MYHHDGEKPLIPPRLPLPGILKKHCWSSAGTPCTCPFRDRVSAYRAAMQCPVLRQRIYLRPCYATSGTDKARALSTYARATRCPVLTQPHPLSAYAHATRCPDLTAVLTWRMVLLPRYGVPAYCAASTDVAYGASTSLRNAEY
eukprot:2544365-Rhodomonas_salina.4